jgi:hypothetical protein
MLSVCVVVFNKKIGIEYGTLLVIDKKHITFIFLEHVGLLIALQR